MNRILLKKILLIFFAVSFILSSFNIGKLLAAEPTFLLSNATIDSKSDGVDANIESFNNNKLILIKVTLFLLIRKEPKQ